MRSSPEGDSATSQHESPTVSREIHSRMMWSRFIGALFIAGFLSYGIGAAIVASIVDDSDLLATVRENETLLATGVFLMLLNTAVDIGKGVLFFPILEGFSKRTALVYFAAVTAQVVIMAVGAILLLMLVPLADSADSGAASRAEDAGNALVHGNTMAYNIGQAVLSFGGVFLSLLLFRVLLIPRTLAGLGIIGYILHGAGSLAELFGVEISIYLLIPGGLFELALAFWLIVKGFNPVAYERSFSSRVP